VRTVVLSDAHGYPPLMTESLSSAPVFTFSLTFVDSNVAASLTKGSCGKFIKLPAVYSIKTGIAYKFA
jgi:hypothetical protein